MISPRLIWWRKSAIADTVGYGGTSRTHAHYDTAGLAAA